MACPYSHCASPSTVVLHSWHKTGTHFFHGVGSSLFHGVCNFTQRRWGVEGCTRAGEELLEPCTAINTDVGIGDGHECDRAADKYFATVMQAGRGARDAAIVLALREPFEVMRMSH